MPLCAKNPSDLSVTYISIYWLADYMKAKARVSFGIVLPTSPAKTTFHTELCNPITRQAIELESCSNPLRIQQVL